MAYFDHNSTTAPFQEVITTMGDTYQSAWSNPSSPHRAGTQVRARLEQAREAICEYLSVDPKCLTFTSGATEANNTVIGWSSEYFDRGSALISAIEHPSVLEACRYRYGNRLQFIPSNVQGEVEVGKVEELLKSIRPTFVSLLAAHNETGVIQPWKEVALLCQKYGAWFHCDATQWIGKLEPDGLGICSSFSFSAHKFGGPKGVGGIFAQEPISWMHGGGQERESRGGTENYPAIQGMKVAFDQSLLSPEFYKKLEKDRNQFEEKIKFYLEGVRILGEKAPRLWNTSFLILPEFDNLSWIAKLDKMGYQLSTGSACSTAREESSGLAKAVGLRLEEERRLVRASGWLETSEDDWLKLADAIELAHKELIIDRDNTGVISL